MDRRSFGTAYTSAISGKHYGLAAAVALAGPGLIFMTSMATLYVMNGAADQIASMPVKARASKPGETPSPASR